MKSNWQPIPGFSLYHASTSGEIKTFNWKNQGKERILKPALDEKGYLRTMLKDDEGNTRTIKVHRIIAKTFLVAQPGRNEINHKNGIKTDNRVFNLEWCNRSENIIHAFSNNLCKAKGKKVINHRTGEIFNSASEAARVNNIPKSTLSCMLTGYRKNNSTFSFL